MKTQTIQKLTQLHLRNSSGLISPGSPFQPFGPQPLVGSSLEISGSEELPHKNISALAIQLSWLQENFPKNFAEYYAAYSAFHPYHNASFKINCLLNVKDGWQLLNNTPLNLFETDQQSGTLLPVSSFSFQLNKKLLLNTGLAVRMELIAPAESFGASLYSSVVMNAMMKKQPLPSPPYIPMVHTLSVEIIHSI